MNNLAVNIIKEQLKDNKRIYLDRFILFVCSLLMFSPFFFYFGKVPFGVWLVLYILADVTLTSKSSRIFSCRKSNLYEDSLPLTNIDQFKIKMFFTFVDYAFEILIFAAVFIIFIFDIASTIDILIYVPIVFFQVLFLMSLPRNFKMIDIDLRRLDSPLKSLLQMIVAMIILLLTVMTGTVSISLGIGLLFDYEIGQFFGSVFESEVTLILGLIIFDIVLYVIRVMKRQVVNEHKIRKLSMKDFDQLIRSCMRPFFFSIVIFSFVVPYSYYNNDDSQFLYSLFNDVKLKKKSINNILKNKDVEKTIKLINEGDFIESKLKWYTREMLFVNVLKNDDVNVLKGITSHDYDEMLKQLCSVFIPKNKKCNVYNVSGIAILTDSKSLMRLLSNKADEHEHKKLLIFSVNRCKLKGIEFYSKKLNISLLDKKYDGKNSILKHLNDNKNKNCWRRVKRKLL